MKVLVAILDNAIEAFGPIMEVRANGEGIRMFIDEANRPESSIHKHPADYDLYKIGMWDETTGELQAMMPPERIARAVDHVGGAE